MQLPRGKWQLRKQPDLRTDPKEQNFFVYVRLRPLSSLSLLLSFCASCSQSRLALVWRLTYFPPTKTQKNPRTTRRKRSVFNFYFQESKQRLVSTRVCFSPSRGTGDHPQGE